MRRLRKRVRGESGGCKVCVRPPRQAPHVGRHKLVCATFCAVTSTGTCVSVCAALQSATCWVSETPMRDLSRGSRRFPWQKSRICLCATFRAVGAVCIDPVVL